MPPQSRHLSVWIDKPAAEVYAYARDPRRLPEWAAGLSGSIDQVAGQWIAESPMGRVIVDFAARNDYGVLDHDVTLPSGSIIYNPVRVIPGPGGCEVVFTLRRRPGMTDEDFAGDAEAVQADLAALRRRLEDR